MAVLPPLGRRVHGLLRGHYSSVIAPADSFANPVWLFFPSALASCKQSSQVATSPCCHRDLPDVISANLSSDAWSPTTAVPRSAYTCFFLRVIGLPPREVWVGFPLLSANTTSRGGGVFEAADISLCSGLRVCSSPRSFLPLHKVSQGSRDFYIRAERASLPRHAPDMLAVRIQAIDGTRTSTLLDSQPCRPLPSPSSPQVMRRTLYFATRFPSSQKDDALALFERGRDLLPRYQPSVSFDGEMCSRG